MGLFTADIPAGIMIYFRPQPDITAFELASIVMEVGFASNSRPIKYGIYITPDDWGKMAPDQKRHWSEVK